MFDLQNKKERLLDAYVSPARVRMPPDAAEWFRKGEECQREGKYDEAIQWHKKIVEKYPRVPDGYTGLMISYIKTGNNEEELRVIRKLIELDPERLLYYMSFTMRLLRVPDDRKKEDLQFIRRYERVNPIVRDILKRVTENQKYHQELKGWIQQDIDEMIRRAHRRGIKVILQTYPHYDKSPKYEGPSFINEALRETAKKNEVLFIDNERLFEQMFLRGENRDAYFEPSRLHCNEKGYGVMAKNIYCGIITSDGLGILPGVDPAEKSQCLDLN